uniref:Uncharacterized protein n=1 Tax=Arundo donax TaxID=35708 RepID=A0A0A8YIK4_ARUDO
MMHNNQGTLCLTMHFGFMVVRIDARTCSSLGLFLFFPYCSS